MASGLEAIAPRHTTHRRARSATTMNIRPLPPLPPLRPHWKGHSRATSVPFRVQDLQQGTGGVAGPSSQGSNGNGGRGARIEESQNAEGGDKGSRHTHAVDFDDASSSYLSMDEYVAFSPLNDICSQIAAVTQTLTYYRTSWKTIFMPHSLTSTSPLALSSCLSLHSPTPLTNGQSL